MKTYKQIDKYITYCFDDQEHPIIHISQKKSGDKYIRFLETDSGIDWTPELHFSRHRDRWHCKMRDVDGKWLDKKSVPRPDFAGVTKFETLGKVVITDLHAKKKSVEKVRSFAVLLCIHKPRYPKGLIDLHFSLNPKISRGALAAEFVDCEWALDEDFEPPLLVLASRHSPNFLPVDVML